MVNLMQRRREMMRLASTPTPTPSINDYVHDSMLLWLDGIENTRSGHNASATKWEDLSGVGRDYTYDSANIINADHFLANGKAISTSLALPTDGSIVTVELVVGFIASSTAQVFIPLGNRFGTTSFGTSNGTAYILFHATPGGTVSNSVFPRYTDADVHTYNSSGYADGSAVSYLNIRASWATAAVSRLFGYNSATANVPTSKIYALRIYSRELTAAEIAKNAALDAARFGRITL